jgi:hypothetical protein
LFALCTRCVECLAAEAGVGADHITLIGAAEGRDMSRTPSGNVVIK